MKHPFRFGQAILPLLLCGLVVAACGRTDLLGDSDAGVQGPTPDGGVGQNDVGVPPSCGDHMCNDGETCATCSVDCGICPGCGDGTCNNGETCTSCPQDCGVCQSCGDGVCNDGETCLTCAPDCGVCPGCGDGVCTPPNETCFTCPADCGKCMGCGDGLCTAPETCASCETDCGPCSVCGNGKCETPYETCVNCPQDCGQCPTLGCPAMLTCAIGCIQMGGSSDGGFPMVSLTCAADCVAEGCAGAQFFFQQAFDCFLANLGQCGTSISCLTTQCQTEVAACIGKSHC